VLDLPPGASRTAVVTGLELAGAYGERRGYRAVLHTETARPGGPVAVAELRALVVLAQGPDTRWRVVAETAGDDPDLPVGGGLMRQEQAS
jgi:ketosteroid isomerase-like protein